MSLRYFHIFFIAASLLLSLGLGAWSIQQGWTAVWPALWFASAAALSLYLFWFIKKTGKAA
jgi:hypothetical protein